ncbi:FAD dependent oxidoreductase [Thecamonas trahens ATCC 50062]|uniref:FAD-dependent oxidoreductase domain-containing protein 1 n=1 Tax=Thecamonas trahens ATCC 50062 TaxID=461836 RepID=A0A0L0D5X5_THETB|nr:FAD dependent oxidoreductase [Thecamonas trahens ATCC 50062]KNC47486.1 FAD dependent oxidoreductase [Thecamonas trahens ATCC 50062]|eukprot:XP_013759422.1 FAD dependent oxidoreductase [Thecamonas trahens ATCC 50062]
MWNWTRRNAGILVRNRSLSCIPTARGMCVLPASAPAAFDVAIVGGGVSGASTAYHLAAADPSLTVAVFEQDPCYSRASSSLSAASIRHQYSTSLNVAISLFGSDFLRRAATTLAVDGCDPPNIGFVERGYLFLAGESGRSVLEENHAIQIAAGAKPTLLDPAGVAAAWPWMRAHDVAAASLGGPGEGWFDAYSLLMAYRNKARSLGVSFVADEVVKARRGADGGVAELTTVSGAALQVGTVVNAAGGWAHRVAQMCGASLPTRPHTRCVFVFETETNTAADCPMLIDRTGVWARPEGTKTFICGVSPPADRDPVVDVTDDLAFDVDYALFDDIIWPALANRAEVFEAIKVVHAWAGVYNMNPFDHNAILGYDPDVSNLIHAAGFSGHGLQQSPAVGRGLSELIIHGSYQTLDLSPFDYSRLLTDDPIVERNVV